MNSKNINFRSTKKSQITLISRLLIYNPGWCSPVPPRVQSRSGDHNQLSSGRVLGHCINARISTKTSSGKAETTVSDKKKRIRPIINLFRWVTFFPLAHTENNVQRLFLVRRSLQTSSMSVWIYWCLKLAHLLYSCTAKAIMLSWGCGPVTMQYIFLPSSINAKYTEWG